MKWFTKVFILLFFGAITVYFALGDSTYGSPTEFGNESDTTCWVGGDWGNITCDGDAVFAKYYGDGSGLTGISTYNATYDALSFADTNETVRFENLIEVDCTAGTLVIGVYDNGTVKCVLDAGAAAAGRTGSEPFLYNDSDTMYWNWTAINDTEWIWPGIIIDVDDEDIEGDMNTYVDIAGDIMVGILEIWAELNITQFANDATTTGRIILSKARGTNSTPVEINAGDILGEILFKGYSGDSSGQETGARIYCKATGTPGQANDMPCNLTFAVSPDNTATPVDYMYLRPDGNISVPESILATAFYGELEGSYIRNDLWLDESGDTLTGDLVFQQGLIPDTVGGAWLGNSSNELGAIYVSTNDRIYLGDDQNASIYFDGEKLVIKVG